VPRILPIDPIAATGLARQTLDDVERAFGIIPMMVRTMARSDVVVAGWAALDRALAAGVLNARTREIIALATAQRSAGAYCLAEHSATGSALGLTPEEQLEARRGHAVDTKEAAAVALALAILETKGGVGDDELSLARSDGLTDAEICEVAANVALNLFTNYFNRLADTEVDFPMVDIRLPKHEA
jgi:AhpD family alkylhydroperoxidase